jgi:chaperonin GroEL (HSP60 family)
MKMAHAVQTLADHTPGKEAQAIEAFARALRQVCGIMRDD